MSQPASKAKKAAPAPLDMRYGFPGKMPQARNKADQVRLMKFFAEYTRDGNTQAAARRAGYSEKWAKAYSYEYLKKHADYVQWLQAHAAQQTVKQIVIEQDTVLQVLANIALANDMDYLVFAEPDEKGERLVRRKRLDELTREQMVAVRVFRRPGSISTKIPDGVLDYTFRNRDGRLVDLAKHVGLLNEKIILERRTLHLHKHDFSQVPIEELEMLEQAFEAAFVRAGAGRLIEAQ